MTRQRPGGATFAVERGDDVTAELLVFPRGICRQAEAIPCGRSHHDRAIPFGRIIPREVEPRNPEITPGTSDRSYPLRLWRGTIKQVVNAVRWSVNARHEPLTHRVEFFKRAIAEDAKVAAPAVQGPLGCPCADDGCSVVVAVEPRAAVGAGSSEGSKR